jgi:ribonucleoside-diphosphate reductase alpha chain
MHNKFVTKRDGAIEDFDINKTRLVIKWATENTSVNPLELEAKVDVVFYDGIKTQDIQENLITHSLSLVSIENQEWLNVAANLRIMTRYKIYRDISFKNFVRNKIYTEEYSSNLKLYSDEELDIASTWVNKELDKIYDYAGASVLISKYLYQDEPLQYAFLATALTIAANEKTNRIEFANKIYNSLSNKKISLASPLLNGVRKHKYNLASCFIGKMGDSIDEIYGTLHRAAKISKNGGGLGIYIGDIRAYSSSVRGVKGASGGIVPWIKLLNDTCVAVNQLGKRAGACTVALPIWHYDIEDFLNLQTEHGDQRKKCFDIFPQIVMYDLFLENCENDLEWYCFDPYEVKNVLDIDLNEYKSKQNWLDNYNKCIEAYKNKKVSLVKEYKAKYIIKELIKTIVETGLPYISYIDTLNKYNPNKHDGNIICTNLCTESLSNVDDEHWHTCSLSSLNLAYIEEDEIEEQCRLITRLLDNILDICEYPIDESLNHVIKYRTIGIGMLGLADYFAKNGQTYESAYESKYLSNLFENIAYFCTDESIELAKEREAYPAFRGSEWSNGNRISNFANHSKKKSKWLVLQSKINMYGIRNSQLLSPAPNTTSGLVQGAVAGILPPFNLLHYDDSSNGSIAIMPPFLSKYPLLYKSYRNYDMMKMIDYVAEMQKWVDTSISFESLMDLTKLDENGKPIITAKYIYKYILKCKNSEIKANYYWRFISKNSDSIYKDDECIGCSG